MTSLCSVVLDASKMAVHPVPALVLFQPHDHLALTVGMIPSISYRPVLQGSTTFLLHI